MQKDFFRPVSRFSKKNVKILYLLNFALIYCMKLKKCLFSSRIWSFGVELCQHCKSLFIKNKAFVGLGSSNNVQTERKIFEYANWRRLQLKRTGLSSWSVQLVRPAGPISRPIYTLHLTHSILHNAPCTFFLHIAS